jgi:uncharacterized coiled-coil DUF342 family protein
LIDKIDYFKQKGAPSYLNENEKFDTNYQEMSSHKTKYQKGKFQNMLKTLIKNAEGAYPKGDSVTDNNDDFKKNADSYAHKRSKSNYSNKSKGSHKKLRAKSTRTLDYSKRNSPKRLYIKVDSSRPNRFAAYSRRVYDNYSYRH